MSKRPMSRYEDDEVRLITLFAWVCRQVVIGGDRLVTYGEVHKMLHTLRESQDDK